MNEDSGKWGNLLLRSPSYDDLFQDYLQNDEIMDMDTEASEDFLTDLACPPSLSAKPLEFLIKERQKRIFQVCILLLTYI